MKSNEHTRMRLHLAYDGTGYLGWQKQTKQEGHTVQGYLETAIFKLTASTPSTTGSGRTDAGVHADEQVVHFDLHFDHTKYNWVRGLNRYLPDQIRVKEAWVAPEGFHAVKSALSKTYIYSLQDGPTPDPLKSRYAHWVPSSLDLDYLNTLSECLIGKHDFKSFQTSGTELATTIREITEFKWIRGHDGLVEAHVSGTGFLKQMVRNMVGCLLHRYWLKELTPDKVKTVLKARDRSMAFGTAPAHGLRLHKVKYPPELDKNCIKS